MTRQWGKREEIDLSDNQITAILQIAEASSKRDYLVIRFMCDCGLRLNEVLGRLNDDPRKKQTIPGIQVENVRWDKKTIWLRGKSSRNPYSGRQEQEVPIPQSLLLPFKDYLGNRDKGRAFDVSDRSIEDHLWKYAREAGLVDWRKVHPHRLRHYFITRVARLTKDPVAARDLARHRSLAVTNRYIAEYDIEQKSSIVERLSH